MSTDLVVPDAILSGGTNLDVATEPWQMLDPCPVCGYHQHDSPQGVNPDGTPRHNFPHCFKCGFRPGINQAVDAQRMADAFEQFKKFVADNNLYQHPTLNPPSTEEADALRAQLAAANQRLAEAGITPEV